VSGRATPPRAAASTLARLAPLVHRVVRRVPPGRVVTYGRVASLIGYPRHARLVGAVMRACPAGVPWHRVVNAQRRISRRARMSGMLTQRILLLQEGVRLAGDRVALRAFGWGGEGRARRGGARRRAAKEAW
jgi:methylated-DNA-protein-cysteine methyltransferase-like protein